jgi:hypothetical protein
MSKFSRGIEKDKQYYLEAWGTRGEPLKPDNTALFAGKTGPQNTVAIVV